MTEQELKRKQFFDHLAASAKIIEGWPDWKKNIWPENTSASYVDYSNYYSEWPGD